MRRATASSAFCGRPAERCCQNIDADLSDAALVQSTDDGGEKKTKGGEGGGWVEPTTVVVKPKDQLQLSEKVRRPARSDDAKYGPCGSAR